MDSFFCNLSSERIAELIDDAKKLVCYAAPGIQTVVSESILRAVDRMDPRLITVCIDFDEKVFRFGYGSIEAVEALRCANIDITHAPMLRSAIIIVDGIGYSFSPTPLYLELEPIDDVRNAILLSTDQVAEALVRFSPLSREIAVGMATSPDEKAHISALPFEGGTEPISNMKYRSVNKNLIDAPPVRFDLARQVRVFEPYLQYIELSLTGAALQRHRMPIPTSILAYGASKEIENRLRTTFDLIEKSDKLSSKELEDALNDIRKNFTRTLGKRQGRVVLKSVKEQLTERLKAFRDKLIQHQKNVESGLQGQLDASREQIVDYYEPLVASNPPDALLGQTLGRKVDASSVRRWINFELERVFPKADALVGKMMLEELYKDVTYETLNQPDFLDSVKNAYPYIDWDKAYSDFQAAGEQRDEVSHRWCNEV